MLLQGKTIIVTGGSNGMGAKKFGFGKETGIELPGETAGVGFGENAFEPILFTLSDVV